MKSLYIIFSYLLFGLSLHAQRKECGTRQPSVPLIVNDSLAASQRLQYTSPLLMKVFVHVIANDNGSLRAVDDTSLMKQLKNMQQFYAAHDICFILVGIEQLNSTDLNTQDASNEESELTPHLVAGSLNIFIHRTLFDNDGSLNGIAYDIPNYYLSVVKSAIESADNKSTTAHEMGHCFGLYHTFATGFGVERIPRSGSCKNCTTAGDLLCDTEADPHSDNYDTEKHITENCVYTGTIKGDNCAGVGINYVMDPHNLMAYGLRACRDVFTNGQGSRARAVINSTTFLQNRIAPDTDNVTTNQTISSGRELIVARNAVTINTASFIVNNSAQVNISSNSEVVIKPGATFSPTTTNAYVSVIASSLCQ